MLLSPGSRVGSYQIPRVWVPGEWAKCLAHTTRGSADVALNVLPAETAILLGVCLPLVWALHRRFVATTAARVTS